MKNFLIRNAFIMGLIFGLVVIATFGFIGKAEAKTAWFYDPDRSGEGIVLSEIDDGRLVFAFYSHVEDAIQSPPKVSPAPPPPEFCDKDTIWLTGLSELYVDGFAAGTVYYDVKNETFPLSEEQTVSKSEVVGDFVIFREGDGFILYMENNGRMCNLSVFGVEHYFTTKLVE